MRDDTLAPTSPLMVRGIRAGSELTGLSDRTVWALCNMNALPHRRVGRAVLFVPAELRAWVAAGCPTKPGAGDAIRATMRAEGGANDPQW